MQTFYEWLSQINLLRLLEGTWFTFDPKQYDQLFDGELEKVIARVKDPACAKSLNGCGVPTGRDISPRWSGTQATVTGGKSRSGRTTS